jgi:hypothetical protein
MMTVVASINAVIPLRYLSAAEKNLLIKKLNLRILSLRKSVFLLFVLFVKRKKLNLIMIINKVYYATLIIANVLGLYDTSVYNFFYRLNRMIFVR